jgi:hypothetical protein
MLSNIHGSVVSGKTVNPDSKNITLKRVIPVSSNLISENLAMFENFVLSATTQGFSVQLQNNYELILKKPNARSFNLFECVAPWRANNNNVNGQTSSSFSGRSTASAEAIVTVTISHSLGDEYKVFSKIFKKI